MDYRKLTAPCGIDCFNCEMFKENITPEMQKLIGGYKKADPSTIGYRGCRESGCLVIPGECETKACISEKKVEFCFECSEFPCRRLQPCLDGAERYPQNFKLFNLCRIQAAGLEQWASGEAGEIRKRYRSGKLQVGNGPVLTGD
jgi:hypothetical protein